MRFEHNTVGELGMIAAADRHWFDELYNVFFLEVDLAVEGLTRAVLITDHDETRRIATFLHHESRAVGAEELHTVTSRLVDLCGTDAGSDCLHAALVDVRHAVVRARHGRPTYDDALSLATEMFDYELPQVPQGGQPFLPQTVRGEAEEV